MQERELFLSALEIDDPDARAGHLQSACGGDVELLARVESLLASHEGQSQFLNTPAIEQLADEPRAEIDATILHESDSTYDGEAGDDLDEAFSSMNEDHDDDIPLGYLQPSDKPDSLGRLGHYEILEVIGKGAFGTVLKAFDEKLQRVVAIKVLAPEMAATSPARKRFLREARASAAVRHENVVSIYAVEDDPTPYLVMEYIPGQTLEQRLNEHGPLDLPDVLRLGKQIADGLSAAHTQNLIHRDVKPGNILLETGVDDHVMITDFGLARTADDASMTQSGLIAGTPMYMAPEQAQGQNLDQRTDLFSFGSVLYQMLSGRPPFRAPTTVAVLKRLTEDTPRPIQEIIPEVPDWMCEIAGHLHAKNPDDRYGTAREVSELLAKCLADVQEGRKPKIPAPSSSADDPVRRTAGPSDPKPILRRPLAQIAAALLILLIGLGITEATGVTKLASTVIRWTTPNGTLVIESDDPSVKIVINGEEVTIRGGGVEELTLRPGEYKIAALKDGKPVKQELVTITKNGRTVMRMSLDPGETIAKSSAGRVKKSKATVAAQSESPKWLHDAQQAKYRVRWRESARKHLEAVRSDPENRMTWIQAAPRLILAGDDPGYRQLCQDMLKHFSGTPQANIADSICKVCLLRPEVVDPSKLPTNQIREAIGVPEWNDYQAYFTSNIALISYRKGDMPQAIEWAEKLAEGPAAPDLAGHTIRAMALYRLGRIEDAYKALTTVEANFPVESRPFVAAAEFETIPFPDTPLFHDYWYSVILHREAVRLIRDTDKSPRNSVSPQSSEDAPPPAIAPFDAEEAKQHQNAWADYLGVPAEKEIVLGGKDKDGLDIKLTLVLIPPGEFLMGSSDEEIAKLKEQARADGLRQQDFQWIDLEGPQRRVRITRLFYVSRTELTKAQFGSFAEAAGYQTEAESSGKGSWRLQGHRMVLDPQINWRTQPKTAPGAPVMHVTWNDAMACCHWLSEQDAELAFSLPTEAQWEYACRAGTTTAWFCGDDESVLKDYAIVNSGWSLAGTKKPNAFGLYDMHGNVWEWCRDSIGNYRDAESVDPVGRDGEKRMIRGGNCFGMEKMSWNNANGCRSAVRYEAPANLSVVDKGFRVVAEISEELLQSKASPGTRTYASDEWIDVISLIEPELDKWNIKSTGKNEWRIEGGELLVGDDDNKPHKLNFPLDSDWNSFECQLDVTLRARNSAFAINIPTSRNDCPLSFGGPGQLGVLIGRMVQADRVVQESLLKEGVRTKLRFEFRRGGETDTLTVWREDQQVGQWSGDAAKLALAIDEGYPHQRRSGLYVIGRLTFHRIRIRMLDGGTATTLRPVPVKQPAPIDLIPLIDGKQEKVRKENGVLVLRDEPFSNLVAPVAYEPVPAEYDLHLEVERRAGRFTFAIGIPYGGHQGMVVIDGWGSKFSGLEVIDGKPGNKNPTSVQGAFLAQGERVPIVVAVRRGSIRLQIGEREIFSWTGRPEQLRLSEAWPDGTDSLFLGAQASEFAVHKFTLTPFVRSAPSDTTGAAPPPAIAPFDVEQAKQHQEAWADYLGVPVENEIVLGKDEDGQEVALTMVLIPPGEFLMGSSDEEIAEWIERREDGTELSPSRLRSEGPRHLVRITRPFWMSRHEFTIGQFRRFAADAEYKTEAERDGLGGWGWKDDQRTQSTEFAWNRELWFEQGDNSPVVNVSWNDAKACCDWLSNRQDNLTFALPSEAQWEYACRAGTTTAWHFGDDVEALPGYMWLGSDTDRTWPVAQKRANPFGLYDMYGNVSEFCSDWYSEDSYRTSATNNPTGPSGGTQRVHRGGDWSTPQYSCRSATRKRMTPSHRMFLYGFRVTAALPGELLEAKSTTSSVKLEADSSDSKQ